MTTSSEAIHSTPDQARPVPDRGARQGERPQNTPAVPAVAGDRKRRNWQRPQAAARATVDGQAKQLLAELEKGLARHGRDGYELTGIGPWALEVRSAAYPRMRGWWQCALDRAANHDRCPGLIYRLNEGAWHVVIALADCSPAFAGLNRAHRIEMDLAAFAALVATTQAATPATPPAPAVRPRAGSSSPCSPRPSRPVARTARGDSAGIAQVSPPSSHPPPAGHPLLPPASL